MLQGCTPWPEEFARRYREQGYWEDKTITELLDLSISKYPTREALVYNDLRLTYTQLGERIDRLTYQFIQIGLRPLDRVVFQLPNSPEFIIAFFALIKIGVIPIMALPQHRIAEIGQFVKHARAVGYLIPDLYRKFDYLPLAREIKNSRNTIKHVFVSGDNPAEFISLNKLIETPVDLKEVRSKLTQYRLDPSEVALMLLSGGTTAFPKMIPRTHNDYVCLARQCSKVAAVDENTIMLIVLLMAHNYNLASPGFLGIFYHGGKIVISPNTESEIIFSLVEKERVTIIPAAMPMIAGWLNSDNLSNYDLSSINVVQNGGAKLPPELRKRLREKIGCLHQENYGMGEGVINMTRFDDEGEVLLYSSGKPVCEADEYKIVDEDFNELPDGEAGELAIRGPYTIRGYYNSPELDAKAFTKDGFYRTGDKCRKDSQGNIYAEGRFKDVINRGGEKINCDEVENLIVAHPKVKNVSLVAMPDEVYGEKACAFVVLKTGEELRFEEMQQFLLNQNIAKFKLPERLEIVEEFPMSAVGKILKRALREIIAEKIAQEKDADTAS